MASGSEDERRGGKASSPPPVPSCAECIDCAAAIVSSGGRRLSHSAAAGAGLCAAVISRGHQLECLLSRPQGGGVPLLNEIKMATALELSSIVHLLLVLLARPEHSASAAAATPLLITQLLAEGPSCVAACEALVEAAAADSPRVAPLLATPDVLAYLKRLVGTEAAGDAAAARTTAARRLLRAVVSSKHGGDDARRHLSDPLMCASLMADTMALHE